MRTFRIGRRTSPSPPKLTYRRFQGDRLLTKKKALIIFVICFSWCSLAYDLYGDGDGVEMTK